MELETEQTSHKLAEQVLPSPSSLDRLLAARLLWVLPPRPDRGLHRKKPELTRKYQDFCLMDIGGARAPPTCCDFFVTLLCFARLYSAVLHFTLLHFAPLFSTLLHFSVRIWSEFMCPTDFVELFNALYASLRVYFLCISVNVNAPFMCYFSSLLHPAKK
jgi:hypothetical protein